MERGNHPGRVRSTGEGATSGVRESLPALPHKGGEGSVARLALFELERDGPEAYSRTTRKLFVEPGVANGMPQMTTIDSPGWPKPSSSACARAVSTISS